MREAVPMARAVLFDVAGTLAMPEARDAWLAGAAASIGVDLGGPAAARALAVELEVAGRPGGPYPSHIPDAVAADYTGRDRDTAAHRSSYVGLLSTVTLHGGAADAGIRTLLLPMSPAGEDHGLAAVLALV
jgi:hypothetical protein